jgi:hypothetical protein
MDFVANFQLFELKTNKKKSFEETKKFLLTDELIFRSLSE